MVPIEGAASDWGRHTSAARAVGSCDWRRCNLSSFCSPPARPRDAPSGDLQGPALQDGRGRPPAASRGGEDRVDGRLARGQGHSSGAMCGWRRCALGLWPRLLCGVSRATRPSDSGRRPMWVGAFAVAAVRWWAATRRALGPWSRLGLSSIYQLRRRERIVAHSCRATPPLNRLRFHLAASAARDVGDLTRCADAAFSAAGLRPCERPEDVRPRGKHMNIVYA